MDEPTANINSAQYYGGGLYCSFDSHEGCLTFSDSYEVNLVCTRNTMRQSEGAVQSF